MVLQVFAAVTERQSGRHSDAAETIEIDEFRLNLVGAATLAQRLLLSCALRHRDRQESGR